MPGRNGFVDTGILAVVLLPVAARKWGYNWIKWITCIEVSDSPLVSGYWESGCYSSSGDLSRSFLS